MSDVIASEQKVEFPEVTQFGYAKIVNQGKDFIRKLPPKTLVGLQLRDRGGRMTNYPYFEAGEEGADAYEHWCDGHAPWFQCDMGMYLIVITADEAKNYLFLYSRPKF